MKDVDLSFLEQCKQRTHFIIRKKLGEGGFGKAYRVAPYKNRKLEFALKICPKKRISRQYMFNRELEINKKVSHPNIAKFYNHFEDQTNHYFVLEYAKYGNLYDFLSEREEHRTKTQPIFSEKEVACIAKQICGALSYCHKNNILHRDLKLENVLVFSAKPLVVKLCDFGHAHYMSDYTGTFGASTSYLAPEEISGERTDATERTETWKVGVLMYELFYGHNPFLKRGESEPEEDEMTDKILYSSFKFKKSIPISKKFRQLIKKCLQEERDDRPTISELLHDEFFSKV